MILGSAVCRPRGYKYIWDLTMWLGSGCFSDDAPFTGTYGSVNNESILFL